MKFSQPEPFEMYFTISNVEERILEVSAFIMENSDVPEIDYVYDLEKAEYVDMGNWSEKTYKRFMDQVYEELTTYGCSYENDMSDYYHDNAGDR